MISGIPWLSPKLSFKRLVEPPETTETVRLQQNFVNFLATWRTYNLANIQPDEHTTWRTYNLANIQPGEHTTWRTYNLANIQPGEHTTWVCMSLCMYARRVGHCVCMFDGCVTVYVCSTGRSLCMYVRNGYVSMYVCMFERCKARLVTVYVC